MERRRPFFLKSHGRLRVDDQRVLIAILIKNFNVLQWNDALGTYGPTKTLYNRWKRWR